MALDQPLVGARCPSCESPAPESPGACPQCGFSVETLKARMGAIPRYSIHVTDSTEAVLTAAEFRAIEGRTVQFEHQFPQSRFTVFITALMPGRSVKEYAFWLFNSCTFTAFDSKLGNNFALLLVIDMQSRSACLMIGYGLEPYLDEADLAALTAKLEPGFTRNRWAEGVRACINATAQLLRERLAQGPASALTPPPAAPGHAEAAAH